jgi:hypothetical protein
MGGWLEDILSQSLDVDNLVQQVQERAASSDPFSIGLGLPEQILDAAGSMIAGTDTETQGNTTTSFSPGSNDSTIDLSGVAQPYTSGQTYQPKEIILFEGKTYINKKQSTGIEPSVFNDNWQNVSGVKGYMTADNEIIEYQNEESKTYTKVPICYAEDIIGKVFSYNKASINGAVEKAVNGMNKYVEDMQSQLDAYESTFTYKAGRDDTNQVISLSDEEGLGDDRGGAGYTTQVSVGTTFRGSLSNTGDNESGGGLTVDIVVSRGGPAGRAPEFTDDDFTLAGMSGKAAVIDEEYYWITLKNEGSGYAYNEDASPPSGATAAVTTAILYNCPTTGGSGTGATVDIYFESSKVKAVRCKLPYTGSVSANGYKLGDILSINGSGATGGEGGGTFVSGSGTGATFEINRKMYQNVGGRLCGPIDDRGITISNGGENYQVGQLVNVDQGPNPIINGRAVGSPSGGGGNTLSGGVNASVSVVGVFDRGDKRAGSSATPALLSPLSNTPTTLTEALTPPLRVFPPPPDGDPTARPLIIGFGP